MEILLATDATWTVEEVTAALGSPDISFVVTTEGRAVSELVNEREIGLAILDMQIGSMGGVAATMDLRLDQSANRAPDVPVLVLLDRPVDAHIVRRSGADGWISKPIDALALKRAVATVANGGQYHDGVVVTAEPDDEPTNGEAVDDESTEAEASSAS